MIRFFTKPLLLVFAVLAFFTSYAQTPNITYTTPQNYKLNIPIIPLKPDNKGGPVPLGEYGTVITFAGNGQYGYTDGAANIASFKIPTGLVTDNDNNIYVSDFSNYVIRKITPQGFVSTFAGNGTGGRDNGTGAQASFYGPTGMAIDPSGALYITDETGQTIRKINIGAQVYLVAGSGFLGKANGNGTAASFNTPTAIAVGPDHNLYVSDLANYIIRKVTPDGDVSNFAGNGTSTSNNGTGAQVSFGSPQGLAFDSKGDLYVCDIYSSSIRKIATDGTVSTFAGNGNNVSVDGTGTTAGFRYAHQLVFDTNDDLFVSDNNLLRKITPQGVVKTVAGNSSESGFVDGVGAAARLATPSGLVFDRNGYLFMGEIGNHVIRKVILTGYTINKPLPPGLTFDSTTGIISGTPTALAAAQDYTITARNKSGISSTAVRIGVNDITPATQPPNIAYATPQIYTIGVPITTLKPSNNGGDVQPGGFSIDAALPPGLMLDANTGYISGTPTAIFPATFFTITAINAKGPSQATLNIKVGYPPLSIPAPPAITYNSPLNKFILNTAIAPLPLQNTGGEVKPGQSNGLIANYAGTGNAGSTNGPKNTATINTPGQLVLNPAGDLLFPEAVNFDIRKISQAGTMSTLVTDVGANGFGLTGPRAMAIDSKGNLFVADPYLIRKVTPAGVISIFAGSGVAGYADGNGKKASFDGIISLAIDKKDNLYATDQSNLEIRKITPNADVSTFAGNRSRGNTDGQGFTASFNSPSAVAVDDNENIIVADYLTIRKITPAGLVSTIAGNTTRKVIDGNGTAASFGNASGVTISPTGEIYIVDTGNNVINEGSDVLRAIDAEGNVSTINIVLNGGVRSFLSQPTGAVFDKNGLLFISGSNNYIQTVSADRYIIDKPLPAGLLFDRKTGQISGTPTELSTLKDYTISAYNTGGPSSETISIKVSLTEVLEPSVITFPEFAAKTTCDTDFATLAKSNDPSVPITYTNSNPTVASVSETGVVKIISEGTTTIRASQSGSLFSLPAKPVEWTLMVTQPNAATKPSPAVDISTPLQTVQEGSAVKFTATTTGAVSSYRWLVNGLDAGVDSPTFTTSTLADHDAVSCTFYFTDICIAPATSRLIPMHIVPIPTQIIIPNSFTPNGDGINDTWQIPALAGLPKCTVSLFSRYGTPLVYTTGYSKAWDGAYNGKNLPAGVYYYIIKPGDGREPLSGSVTILK